MAKHCVLSGADRIDAAQPLLQGRRVGLMTNPTGIDRHFRSTADVLHARTGLSALFAPEHGIRGDIQAGEQVDTFTDPETGVTVYSAYGEYAHFSDEMLDAFDVLVFDMQDVGARFYTFLYSLAYAMQACARAGKRMVVLDRLNPLGGVKLCGTVLDPAFASFVGDYELPTQYALTIGEYALYVRRYLGLDVDLHVIPLEGWRREYLLDDTDVPWVAPSPNCPDLEAALCYIGTCVFEGTNISEGRGTTLPFRVAGAPFIDGARLEKRMNALGLKGLHFRRTTFRPTFSKHAGELCHGVQMHVTDRDACDCFAGGLHLLEEMRALAPDHFEWLDVSKTEQPHYFVDDLLGTDALRTGRLDAAGLVAHSRDALRDFEARTMDLRLYR